jgi:hypothetical protein
LLSGGNLGILAIGRAVKAALCVGTPVLHQDQE